MRMLEIFDRPGEYYWHRSGGDILAFFQIDKSNFVVTFSRSKDTDFWMVDFKDLKSSYGHALTGKGNSIQVFSTVLEIIKDFIRTKNPEGIIFSAFDDEPTRQGLYNTLVRVYAKKYKVEKEHVTMSSFPKLIWTIKVREPNEN